jgi:O-antigen ligase
MPVRPSLPAADPAGLVRLLVPLALLAGAALVISRGLSAVRVEYALAAAAAGVVFVLVFLRSEIGLYLVVLSMLLSPELTLGGGGLAERREIVFRSEDFLLLVIAVSWFAKTAVNKELGLVLATPLNRPILAYIGVAFAATLVGYLTGTVRTTAGFFYVLKYLEYVFVFYMVVNNVADRAQVRRVVGAAFLTAALVALVGIAQIPSGQRVSAPFEGEVGEPNTFGGYLLFMIAILLGIALETRRLAVRAGALALVALLGLPFAFTLSRASYLGVVPMIAALAFLSTRRRLMMGVLLLTVVASPVVVALAPAPVVKRIAYTFQPERGQPTVRLGRVGLDPSTSARFISFKEAVEGWLRRPILGYGVTGFGFMDAQYARTLVETGIVGLAAFLWLVLAVLRTGVAAYRAVGDPEDRGLALGFVAGTVGLLTHAIGSNTFIIVRIMEPFWLFAGIVVMLHTLAREPAVPAAPAPAVRRGPSRLAMPGVRV